MSSAAPERRSRLPRQRTGDAVAAVASPLPAVAGEVRSRLQLLRPSSDRVPGVETRLRRSAIQMMACVGLLATVIYLLWRTFATLSGSTLWLSVPLVLLEVHAFVGLALFTHDLWNVDAQPDRPRHPSPADHVDIDTLIVAVLIPTFDEPREILLPTIAAAVATRRDHATWVLDDGDRLWVRELAADLGACYRSRRDGSHAKAGNLNEALSEVGADVVAVVDADHVVTEGFLDALLPYFSDAGVALVQSPQDFYNDSSFEHVPLPGGGVFADQEMFYRAVLAGRNRWQAAFWCGTGALVRVAALESVGGVATDSVTEDIQTTIRLHRKGWRTVHHNEVVAHGLAAHDPASFFIQRNRWGAGAMQVLHHEKLGRNRGLTSHQRVSYLSTLLGWFDSWRTIGYILLPIATLVSGGLPVAASWSTFVVAFLGTFVLQRVVLKTLSRGRAPLLHATYFEFVRLQATFAATLTFFGPGPSRFVVTPKAPTRERRRAGSPPLLTVLLALSAVAAGWYAATLGGLTPTRYPVPWVAHGTFIWLIVNAAFLVAAAHRIRQLRYASNRRNAWRFDAAEIPVRVQLADGHEIPSTLIDISLTGARLHLDYAHAGRLSPNAEVVLLLPLSSPRGEQVLAVRTTVRSLGPASEAHGFWAGVVFDASTAQQARLALALYRTVDSSTRGSAGVNAVDSRRDPGIARPARAGSGQPAS